MNIFLRGQNIKSVPKYFLYSENPFKKPLLEACSGFQVAACEFVIIFLFHKAAWKFKFHRHMLRKFTDLILKAVNKNILSGWPVPSKEQLI